ncbi:C25 family cysteine peptidase [Maridesulfovibrio bastinii]|uniref:C25 family cysteine peptidase n=1 Tax=Maridesulfovibrio bastinii TaxID=47157 RepID=UPI0003FD2DE9|nr:C25 family cysteine peptidase [Maridesulfovibrio bastinii]
MKRLSALLCSFFCLCAVISFGGCKLNLQSQEDIKPVESAVKVSSAPFREKKKSVIVFRPEFKQAARYFSYLHRQYEGVDSLLLSVHAGNSTQSELEKIADDIRLKIKELDKKYGVLTVLLLGDFKLIPAVKYNAADNSTSYIADAGYGYFGGSPESAISVGRIPAKNPEQAFAVAEKFDSWYGDRDYRPAWPVVFMGGEGLSGQGLHDSELIFFRLQEEGMAGPEAIRYLGGVGGCNEERFLKSLSWDDAAIQWLMVPGSDGTLKFGNSFVNSTDIMSLEYKPGLPIVLDPYCHLNLNKGDKDQLSTPEAMLLSPGAALGVMVGGNPVNESGDNENIKAELDKGTLLRVDLSGRSLFMLEFHRAYFSGKLRISDALTEARSQYAGYEEKQEHLKSDILADFVFLGDPTMSMPMAVRTESPVYRGLKSVSRCMSANDIATYPANSTITFAMPDNSIYSSVLVRVVDRNTGRTVAENTVGREDLFNFSTDTPGRFMFYSHPVDGPLAWQFFDVRGKAYAGGNSTVKPIIKSGLEPIKYSVQVSSNRIMSSAVSMRKRLEKKGYPAYVVTSVKRGGKPWYCVRFGEYESIYKAQAASSGYEKTEKADAKIVRCKIDN